MKSNIISVPFFVVVCLSYLMNILNLFYFFCTFFSITGDRRISFFLQDNEKCIENDGESENSSNTTLTIQEEEEKKGI